MKNLQLQILSIPTLNFLESCFDDVQKITKEDIDSIFNNELFQIPERYRTLILSDLANLHGGDDD